MEHEYFKNQILTASPEQLQLMLYEGLIISAKLGRLAQEIKRFEQAQDAFERCDAILCELRAGLRPELAPELCENMTSLYQFIDLRLTEGNLTHDPALIDEALQIMMQLKETWVLMMDKNVEERRG